MIRFLSVPMIATGFVSSFFCVFYLYLGLKTQTSDKKHRSYLIFSILSFVNTVYVTSFSILVNSSGNLAMLDISNRITILSSMYVILLAFHFNKHFFDIHGKKDLIVFYSFNAIFSFLCFLDHRVFLASEFFPTSRYYTGLVFGPLFQLWGLYVIVMMTYAMVVVFRTYLSLKNRGRQTTHPIFFIFIATILWNTAGVLDALTAMHVIDLPPLTWVGSLVMILSIEIMLVMKIENLYVQINTLYEQVSHDSSTSVFSKSYFEMELDRSLRDTRIREGFHYLIIADIDDFKAINDIYGHVCGDYVLRRIAEIMKSNLRKPDIIARYGGDEFIIHMINNDGIEVTMKIIERIRTRISDENFSYMSQTFHVTCSFGVTLFDKSSNSAAGTRDEIVAKADAALYHSKRQGKNKVHLLHIEQ